MVGFWRYGRSVRRARNRPGATARAHSAPPGRRNAARRDRRFPRPLTPPRRGPWVRTPPPPRNCYRRCRNSAGCRDSAWRQSWPTSPLRRGEGHRDAGLGVVEMLDDGAIIALERLISPQGTCQSPNPFPAGPMLPPAPPASRGTGAIRHSIDHIHTAGSRPGCNLLSQRFAPEHRQRGAERRSDHLKSSPAATRSAAPVWNLAQHRNRAPGWDKPRKGRQIGIEGRRRQRVQGEVLLFREQPGRMNPARIFPVVSM